MVRNSIWLQKPSKILDFGPKLTFIALAFIIMRNLATRITSSETITVLPPPYYKLGENKGGKTVMVCSKPQNLFGAFGAGFTQKSMVLYLLLRFYRRRRKFFELFASFYDDFAVKNVDFSMQKAESKYQIPKIFACGAYPLPFYPPPYSKWGKIRGKTVRGGNGWWWYRVFNWLQS